MRKVEKLQKLGFSAVALDAETIEANPSVWNEVSEGYYQFVYATPEVLLDNRMPFFLKIMRNHQCEFRKHLVAVGVDECHLIWDWESFRKAYADIGRIKLILRDTPFICASATLTRNVAAYVHSVCSLRFPTVRFNLPIRRDNINLIVAMTEPSGITDLLSHIPRRPMHCKDIPKMLIFHDSIDSGVHLCNQIIAYLPRKVERIAADVLVQCYHGSQDAKAKTKTLEDLIKGDCRIVVCTEAFGLGVDIEDIEIVVQWHVDEKLKISTLSQRLGRAARGDGIIGVGIVYISRTLLPKGWRETIEGWKEHWQNRTDVQGVSFDGDEDDAFDDLRVVPEVHNRNLGRYGLPVNPDTETWVIRHLMELYRNAKNVKEAIRRAKTEMTGTKKQHVPLYKKLEPGVLWYLCVQGCRHKILGCIFLDPDNFNRTHKDWCCDWCVSVEGGDFPSKVTAGISCGISILCPTRSNPEQTRPKQRLTTDAAPQRQQSISLQQARAVKFRLKSLRLAIWRSLGLPDVDEEIVFSNEALEGIVGNVNYILTTSDVISQLRISGIIVEMSLLTERNIQEILTVIEYALSETMVPQNILPKPTGNG